MLSGGEDERIYIECMAAVVIWLIGYVVGVYSKRDEEDR